MRRSYVWKGVCMWIRQYCAGVKLLTTCTSTHRVRVLDLCSSWVSHIPPWAPVAAVSGLGMNAEELRCNPLLSERVVLDLNSGPGVRLPFQTEDFHAVLLQLSMWEALTLYLVAFLVYLWNKNYVQLYLTGDDSLLCHFRVFVVITWPIP